MKSRRPLIGAAILLVIAVIVFVLVRRGASHDGLEATGTVEATESALGFTAPGRLQVLRVDEGDTVAAGAPLASLDRSETQARRDQAAAQAAAARAQLRELERGSRPEEIATARAEAKAAADQLAEAERNADRVRALAEKKVVSQQDDDQAATALQVARSRSTQAQQQLKLVEAGPRREKIDSARAQLDAAEASVKTLDASLAQMEIVAPFRGVITVRHHQRGEIVAAGSPVVTVLNRDDRWVRIYVPEDRIGAVRVGEPARIRSDTFKNRDYTGEVTTISSEAEFTPKTVQTREERVKLVYAVKVRITGDPGYDLKPGMPADVTLDPARP
ncbi:MAG TPA: efflux RND transporter periplasmic adaptor subunit [Dongiaceae bacterium]|nr:efflux RND transporter periplasmic adaptor subunit [Dongiaceae bacterium]